MDLKIVPKPSIGVKVRLLGLMSSAKNAKMDHF